MNEPFLCFLWYDMVHVTRLFSPFFSLTQNMPLYFRSLILVVFWSTLSKILSRMGYGRVTISFHEGVFGTLQQPDTR